MGHLRLSPSDYRALVRIAHHFEWPDVSLPLFRKVLVLAVGWETELGKRLEAMEEDEVRLLYERLQSECDGFTDAEMLLLTEAFDATRYCGRHIELLHRVFVHYFQERSPRLAQKLERLSDRQFKRLFKARFP